MLFECLGGLFDFWVIAREFGNPILWARQQMPPPPLLVNIVTGIWSWQFAYDKKAITIYIMYMCLVGSYDYN